MTLLVSWLHRGYARRACRAAALVVVVAAIGSTAARAQSGVPARAYRGLFGSTQTSGDSLTLSVMADLTYVTRDVASGAQLAQGVNPTTSRTLGGGRATLVYSGDPLGFQMTAGGSADLRYALSGSGGPRFGMSGFARGGGNIGQRVSFSLSEAVRYSPFYLFGGFSDIELGIDPADLGTLDAALFRSKSITYHSQASLSYRFSTRVSAQSDFAYRYTHFLDETERGDLREWRAGGRVSYQFSRFGSVFGGYRYRPARTALRSTAATRVASQMIDGGVNLAHGISLTRRLTLNFSTGSSIIVLERGTQLQSGTPPTAVPDAQPATGGSVSRRVVRLTGVANLAYDIGRSWIATAGYVRSLRFYEQFTDPVYADSVFASTSGFLGPKLNLMTGAAYTNGSVGVGLSSTEQQGRRHRAVRAVSGAQYALSRGVALYAQAFYFRYLFGRDVVLPTGLGSNFARMGARAGVAFSVPLVR